jgi:hypothetical protein
MEKLSADAILISAAKVPYLMESSWLVETFDWLLIRRRLQG